ncbi:MAG: SiaB family protein kinase [Thiohalospira sp.]
MANDNQILYYKGFLDYAIVNKLLKELFEQGQSGALDIKVFKKIQIVMVEMLENSYKYISEMAIPTKSSEFLPEFKILKENKFYRLIASNPIYHNDVDDLKQHIDKINNTELPELQKWYKEILKNEIYSKKKSPGIGLIRIAKVVRNKFKYSFQEIDNKFLYYTLEILINTK